MARRAPLVSVLMPVFNRRRVVCEAVDSLCAQTLEDWELLVVDDGSTDGSADVVRERYGDDARVRVFQQPNRGISSARNAALDHARGTFVALLDSDDLFLPACLETHVAAMGRHPEAAMTIADVRYEGNWPAHWNTWFARHTPPASGADMCRGGYILMNAAMYRADVLKALRFDEDIQCAEDTELAYRFFEAGHKTAIVDAVVAVYRSLGEAAGAEQITHANAMVRLSMLELQERFAHLAADPRAHARLLARRWTHYHLKFGDTKVGRGAARRWWALAPWDLRAPLSWIRGALRLGRARIGAP